MESNSNSRNCLVTGATGFVGRALVALLIKERWTVRVVTRSAKKVDALNVEIVVGDLTDPTINFAKLVEGVTTVFHCAAELTNAPKMRDLHVLATQKLIQATVSEIASRGKSAHWVQLSSVGVYGPPKGNWMVERHVTEETIQMPKGEYENSKLTSDRLLEALPAEHNLSYAILRPSNIVGIGMKSRALVSLIHAIEKGYYFGIGNCKPVANYVHVGDVVEALVLCANRSEARGQVFNISNDCPFSGVVNVIAKSLKIGCPDRHLPAMLVRIFATCIDKILPQFRLGSKIAAVSTCTHYPTNKLVKILNFAPKVDIVSFIGQYAAENSASNRVRT